MSIVCSLHLKRNEKAETVEKNCIQYKCPEVKLKFDIWDCVINLWYLEGIADNDSDDDRCIYNDIS